MLNRLIDFSKSGLIACTLFVSACSTTASFQAIANFKLKSHGQAWQSLKATTLDSSTYLVLVSEQSGLLVGDISDSKHLVLEGKYEHLDVRPQGDRSLLVFTVEQQSNIPQLIEFDVGSTSIEKKKTQTFKSGNFQIDGLCLYRDSQQNLFAFLLDGYGGGEMRWLLDGQSGRPVDASVKALKLPPGSDQCSVSDENETLFITEESIGVWQYPANPETEWQRSLITENLYHPEVPAEISAIDAQHDILLVATQKSINLYTQKNKSWQLAHAFKPPKQFTSSAITSYSENIVLLDEKQQVLQGLPALEINPLNKSQNHLPVVAASVQTEAMQTRGDAADDPAIWVHPQAPEKSRILGTNKKWGLMVYNLNGEREQAIATGHINNIDIRQQVASSEGLVDIAVASNRSDNSMALYKIDPASGEVSTWAALPTNLNEVYGICLYAPSHDEAYVFINDKNGLINQYQLLLQNSAPAAKLIQTFQLQSQPEACVADDKTGVLFVGEEDVGIWRFNLKQAPVPAPELIAKAGEQLVSDIEGIDLVENQHGKYLIISSQGDSSYAILEGEAPFKYLAKFRIGFNADKRLDGASETDGLAVTGKSLGEKYPDGLLVVQDGYNLLPEAPQNFKLVDWQLVIKALGLKNVHD